MVRITAATNQTKQKTMVERRELGGGNVEKYVGQHFVFWARVTFECQNSKDMKTWGLNPNLFVACLFATSFYMVFASHYCVFEISPTLQTSYHSIYFCSCLYLLALFLHHLLYLDLFVFLSLSLSLSISRSLSLSLSLCIFLSLYLSLLFFSLWFLSFM